MLTRDFCLFSDGQIGFRELSSVRSETKGKKLRNTVAFWCSRLVTYIFHLLRPFITYENTGHFYVYYVCIIDNWSLG